MAADDDAPNNPFVRFRHHVDSNVQRGFQTVFGENTGRDHVSSQSPGAPASDSGVADVKDIFTWALSSPYSPFHLQHLPQPHPRDAPANSPHRFTFRDAFEDLLTVNSGRPLPDIQGLLFAKHFEHAQHSFFGLHVADWVTDLGRRGLWEAYFPLSPWDRHELTTSWMRPFGFSRIIRDWELEHRPSAFPREPRFDTDPAAQQQPGTLTKEVASKDAAESSHRKPADSEADLYAAVRSDFALDSPVAKGSTKGMQDRAESSWDDDCETIDTPDGGKISKTVHRRTRDGETALTTTTQQYDADGNLVAQDRTTTFSKTMSHKFPGASFMIRGSGSVAHSTGIVSSNVNGENDGPNEQSGQKSSGWFWTK